MKRFKPQEAADYIGVSKGYLDRLRTAGGGPRFIKLGKKVLYDIADIDRWIESKKQISTADLPALRIRNRREAS